MKICWQLFRMGLWLGSTVFGGGGQAYPVIRHMMTERGWLSGEEVDGLYALAAFLPGPTFLNLWGAVSARLGGFWGSLAGEAGLLLPSFLLVCFLPEFGRFEFIRAHTDSILLGTVWATIGLLLAIGMQGAHGLKRSADKLLVLVALVLLFVGIHPSLLIAGTMIWAVTESCGSSFSSSSR